MKLERCINGKDINLKLTQPINWLIGDDVESINNIIQYLKNYFNKEKIHEQMYLGRLPSITYNQEEIPQNTYTVLLIQSLEDIEYYISQKKVSLAKTFLHRQLMSIEIQEEIVTMNQSYLKIQSLLNNQLHNSSLLQIEETMINEEILLNKNLNFSIPFNTPLNELLTYFINLVIDVSKIDNQNYLIIFNHINSILNQNTLKKILSNLNEKELNLNKIIFTSSQSSYIYTNHIENINYINNKEIHHLFNYNQLQEILYKHHNKEYNQSTLEEFIIQYSSKVFNNNLALNIDSFLINQLIKELNKHKTNENNENITMSTIEGTIII